MTIVELLKRPKIINIDDIKETTNHHKNEIINILSLNIKKESKESENKFSKQVEDFKFRLKKFINLDPNTQLYIEDETPDNFDIVSLAEYLETMLDISKETKEYLKTKGIKDIKQKLENIYSDSNSEMNSKDHEKKIKIIFNGIRNEILEKIPNLEENIIPAA